MLFIAVEKQSKWFRLGCKKLNDRTRSGAPKTVYLEVILTAIKGNQWVGHREYQAGLPNLSLRLLVTFKTYKKYLLLNNCNVPKILRTLCLSQANIHAYIHTYIWRADDKFPYFFVWELLLIEHTWNCSPLRSNLIRLQRTCTVPTNSGRLHGSPLVWACQWPSSQLLSSPQLSLGNNPKSQGTRSGL